jgi:hypothetical protein
MMAGVQDYITSRPKPQQQIMAALRDMALDSGIQVEEKISYGVPFFYFRGPLCYLNPKFDGVYIGFVRGNQLSNEQQLLTSNNRKYIRSIHFHSLTELEEREKEVRQILNEAAILNDYHFRQKQKNNKKK